MKKKPTSESDRKPVADAGDLQAEYRFDYRKAKPNRFAALAEDQRTVVVLDPDVSEVFRTPDSVNAVLRALLETMPSKRSRKVAAGSGQGAKG